MSKVSDLRVFGGRVGSKQSYVDYSIVGTDERGRIHVENANDDTETIIFTTEEVQAAFEDEVAMNGSDIPAPNSKLWDMMDTMSKRRTDGSYNNFADQRIQEAQKSLFLAAVEEGKDE